MGYYGFLATRVPPRRLLATAARRALRGTFGRLAAPPEPPTDDRLLAAFGVTSPGALAERLAARAHPAPPAWTTGALRRALERHLPDEHERVLSRAEAAAAGRLMVFGRMVEVSRAGGGTDWQRDPHQGGRFDGSAPAAELPDVPGLDRKLAWAVGRGEHWVALAQGAVLDVRGEPLVEALAASVRDFVRENPVGRGVQWSCAMEAALRAVNASLAIHLLRARGRPLPPGLALDVARLAVTTGRFVLANLEDRTAVPNNHLAADWLGLLACAAFAPEWPEAARWRALARAGIAAAIRDQIHEDGTTFEGSVPYHRLALEIFATALLAAHAAGTGLGLAYARRLAAAFRAARALLSAAGALPQLGDNDSGRVLALRERGGLAGGYLLPLGAALLRDPGLLIAPGPGDAAEVAWLLGPGALDWLAAARPGPPPASAAFRGGGFHVVRRGGLEAFVSAGANGQRGLGGHSHNDKLALELRVDGALAVCDPGSPSYTGDPALRDAFRSTRAHATVVVDGLEQAPIPPGRPFALPEAASARLLALEEDPAAARLTAEHRGYARAGVIHRREVVLAERGAVILDLLSGDGRHALELRWPLATRAVIPRAPTPEEATALAELAEAARLPRSAAHPALGAAAEGTLEGGGRVLVALALPAGLSVELAPTLYSPGYGELEAASALVAAGEAALPAGLVTLFLPLPLTTAPLTKGTPR